MYHSTRGKKKVSASTAIVEGLAEDGGLYITDEIPTLSYIELMDATYQQMAAKILSLFFKDFKYEDIITEIEAAYSVFDINSVVDIKHLKDFSVLELFHGPTAAFKDLALVVLPRMLKLAKAKKMVYNKTTILTATSGDTGGATLSGFKNVDGVEVIVLYPTDGVSPLQEAQMQSFNCDNGHVIPVKGNFDECQTFVKNFFINNKHYNLSSANSINISRLVPQIVYYYFTYVNLVNNKKITAGERVSFVVPTGNFGDILAGYIAKKMGLPIDKLVCASNENNVLTEFFESKIYNANRTFYKTNSPSMDIVISSNLERLLYFETKSTRKVRKYMKCLRNKQEYKVNLNFPDFNAYAISQEETKDIIGKYYQEYNYLVDPHTAVAIGAYEKFKKINSTYTVVLSTASPLKFSKTVLEAIKVEGEDIDDLCRVLGISKPAKFNYPAFNKESVELDKMASFIREVIACYTLE